MQQSHYLSDLLRNTIFTILSFQPIMELQNTSNWKCLVVMFSTFIFSSYYVVYFFKTSLWSLILFTFIEVYRFYTDFTPIIINWKENDVARLQFSSDGSGMSYPKSDFWNHANMVLKGKLNKVFPNIFAKCHISIPKPRFRIPGSATNAILNSELQYISLHFVTVSQCVV